MDPRNSDGAVGVLLAGGSGTRLGPITLGTNKHLVPLFDKPLIYYPLSTLMLAGVRSICIVCNEKDSSQLAALLGHGDLLGIEVLYRHQDQPLGVVDGFLRAADVSTDRTTWLALGDNVLLGAGLGTSLREEGRTEDCRIFAYEVADTSRYGTVTLDPETGHPASLLEKPPHGGRGLAIPGLYRLPKDAIHLARTVRPSERGELEIVDLLNLYLASNLLELRKLPRGSIWIDAGTPAALMGGGHLLSSLTSLQGRVLACPEEIAWRSGWISDSQLAESAKRVSGSHYGDYLLSLLKDDRALGSP